MGGGGLGLQAADPFAAMASVAPPQPQRSGTAQFNSLGAMSGLPPPAAALPQPQPALSDPFAGMAGGAGFGLGGAPSHQAAQPAAPTPAAAPSPDPFAFSGLGGMGASSAPKQTPPPNPNGNPWSSPMGMGAFDSLDAPAKPANPAPVAKPLGGKDPFADLF